MSELLKNKFMDFEPEPERDVWASIEKELRPVSRKGFIPVWRKLAVAASLLILFGSGIFYITNRTENPDTQIVAIENIIPEVKTTTPQLPEETAMTASEGPANAQTTPIVPVSRSAAQKSKSGTHQKTSTYIVQVTETYKDNQPQPVATEITQQKVTTPVAIVSENNPQENKSVQTEEEPETEWIVYEIPVRKKKAAQPVAPAPKNAVKESRNSGNSLNLNNLEFDNVASFATQQLNKVINMPFNVKEEYKSNHKNVTYQLNLKNVKVVQKKQKPIEREY